MASFYNYNYNNNILPNYPNRDMNIEIVDFSYETIKSIIDNHPHLLDAPIVPISSSHWTFLHMAADTSNEELVDYLLQKNAQVNKEIYPNGTALHVAASKPNARIIQKLILRGADVNGHRSKDNWVPLCCAIDAQIPENVSLIIGMGGKINPNIRNMALGPLHIAVSKNDEDMIQFLVNASIDLEATTEKNSTALCYAVEQQNLRMVQFLLEQNADVETSSEFPKSVLFGMKPLHLAVISKNLEIIKELLLKNADVNGVTCDIQTPLHLAMIHRSYNVVTELLAAGANVSIVNQDNQTSLDICINGDNNKPMRKILKHHAVKMMTVGVPVHFKILSEVSKSKNWMRFYNKCGSEIEVMKNTNMGNTCYMYYYLVFKSIHLLSICARNSEFISAASETILKDKFPLFADIMLFRLKKAQVRKNLVVYVEEFICENLSMLPTIVIHQVFHYLTNRDMEILHKNLDHRVSVPLGHWGYNPENLIISPYAGSIY